MKVYKTVSQGTGVIGYGVDYFDSNGDRQRRIVSKTKKGAEKILAKIAVELETGEYYDRKKAPKKRISDAIVEYRTYFAGKDSAPTESGFLDGIEAFFGKRLISSLTSKDIEEFQRHRQAIPSRRGGKKNPGQLRSDATINREVECLRRLCNKAIEWGYIKVNPVNSKILFEEKKERISYLTAEEAGRLLKVATRSRNIMLNPVVLTALETGMRRGEILNMTWADVDPSRQNIFIPETKTDRSRNVPMSRRLMEMLKAMPRRIGTDYVFPSKGGKPLHEIRKSFKCACRRAGIPASFRFHDLRHTMVTHCLDAGVPIHVVGKIIGHSTSEMTERYGHLLKGRDHEAVERLPEWETAAEQALTETDMAEFWQKSS